MKDTTASGLRHKMHESLHLSSKIEITHIGSNFFSEREKIAVFNKYLNSYDFSMTFYWQEIDKITKGD